MDLIADVSGSWGILSLSGGIIHYLFPNTGLPQTTELYGAVGLDVLLSPTVTVYADVDEVNGAYMNLSLDHTFENVCEPIEGVRVSVDVSAAAGFGSANHNAFYYGTATSAMTDLTFSAGFPISIGEHWTVTPAINYSTIMDGRIRRALEKDDNVWSGVSVTFSF